MAPTLPHCVSSLPPKGARFTLGRPGGETLAPTLPHCVSSLPPKGARFTLGRPGGETLAPTLPHCASSSSPARQGRGARGFTLIELLVAIGAMALLALMSWRGIDGMVRAQEQTRQRADQLLVLQAALGQWGADLDALVTVAHTTSLDWDGQVLRMTRRTSEQPDTGLHVVAWTRRDVQGTPQWLRWQSPPLNTRGQWLQAWTQAAQWAHTPGEAERRREVVLMPLEQWQIFYHRGGAWINPLSTQTSAGGEGTLTLPDGVRLEITLPPGAGLAGHITRDWVNPVLGGNKS